MTDTREALVPQVGPPNVLWFPFAVLVFVGLGTTLAATVYLVIVTLALVADDGSVQWQAFPFGIGMLALGIGALLGARALWRQRRKLARMLALVVLPLIVAVGAADRLVLNDDWGLRLNPFVALSLLVPVAACAVFFLPSVHTHYRRLTR